MKRRHFIAELNRKGMGTVAMTEKFAFNSAIRASEDLVRDLAHATSQEFGATDNGSRWGEEYRRSWRGSRTGETVITRVAEVF